MLGANLENLTLTGAAVINGTGNALANTLTGNDPANVLNGGTGTDILIGGLGNDFYYVDNAGDQIIEAVGGGTDYVRATVSYTLAAGQQIENFTTTREASTAAINLTGNAFDNIIRGNAGANVLDGSLGNDTLTGLGGADTFVFKTALGSTNIDHIADFAASTNAVHDTIQLNKSVFTALTVSGELQASTFKDLSTGTIDADDRILYNKTTGALFYDADGSGGSSSAVQFAVIDNKITPTHNDLFIV